jgi:hypothetical protein
MPNLTYSIRESGGTGGRTTIIGIKAVRKEIAQQIRDALLESAKEGAAVARANAPRNKFDPDRNRGHKISDSIRVSESEYAPGGVGGGGSYKVELIADGAIAPHLRYVWQGTGNIRPSRGNVLLIEKGGEGTQFRTKAKGQQAQTEWWEDATRALDAFLQDRIRKAGLGESSRV